MKRSWLAVPCLALAAILLIAAQPATVPAAVKHAMSALSTDALRAHDRYLSSDLLEGRGPGTRGDALAEEYIAAQFESFGLKPGGDDGTYYQHVPLIGITMNPAKTSVSFTKPGAPAIGPLKYLDQFVATDQSQQPESTLDSEVVFVGHGVVAPEYRWDDYKGLDTRGKTLVMLVDDPPANAQEPDLFKGKARTYYGRWTYKYEMGTAKGAQGVILIHTNEAAGYPWGVVRNSWGSESSFIGLKPGEQGLKFASWVTEPVAAELFKAAGLDLNAMTKAAASRDFKPVSLGYHLTGTIASNLRKFNTENVVAKLEGSDPKLRDEAVIYTAHHDHLGVGKPDEHGDAIYNGALDNASGCAILIEMARVWSETNPKPKRSIYFSAVAAEEQGLIGSAYQGKHPPIPAGRIALDLNYDMVFELGRVKDVTLNGIERTTFFPTVQHITKELGLTIIPDPEPEQGHYYRSDHFSFGKVGIPAVSIEPGPDVIGKPEGWGKAQTSEFREKHYHEPSDNFDPKWDWNEAKQMAELGFWLGWDAANAPEMPNWKPGDEFRAARDKSLAALK